MAEKSALTPAYLIFGTDTPKVRRAVGRFKRRVVAEAGSDLSLTTVEAGAGSGTLSGAEVVDLLQTGSFVPGRRAVVVEAADRWKVGERNLVAKYLADPYPETTVVLVGEAFDPRESLTKAVVQGGTILQYDVPKHGLAPWVRELARGLQLEVSPAEARHLLHVVGEDPAMLESELRKLAGYVGAVAGGELVEVDESDIDAVCSPGLEAKIWDLTDAVGKMDRPAAFRVLEELFALGGAPRSAGGSFGDPTRFIFVSLARHIDLLRQAHLLPVMSAEAAGKELGVHSYRARRLLEQRKTFSMRAVEHATVVLAEADAALVGGSQLEPELVLERALLRLVS